MQAFTRMHTILIAALLVVSGNAIAAPEFKVEFDGAVKGLFTEGSKADTPPDFEYQRYANEGTNRKGPYELEFNARLVPMELFGETKGHASVHFRIKETLEPGRYDIGTEGNAPISVNVYTQDRAREMEDERLWFIEGASGSFTVQEMNRDAISGTFQFTAQNRTGSDSVTVSGAFNDIPYLLKPDIKVKLGGAFKQPEPPPFMEADVAEEGDTLTLVLKQQWGFTLEATIPTSAENGEKIMVGEDAPASAQLVARGHDPFPLSGWIKLDSNGEMLAGDFKLNGSIKGKPGSIEGWFDFVSRD